MTNRLAIYSDLHTEFSDFHVPEKVLHTADVICLAGDIGVGMGVVDWIERLNTKCRGDIVFIPGNHEYYHQDIDVLWEELVIALHGTAHLLSPLNPYHRDDLTIIGDTLWTDYALDGEEMKHRCIIDAERFMNDHNIIRKGNQLFRPVDALRAHMYALSAMDIAYRTTRETSVNQKIVMMTHHGCSPRSTADKFKGSVMNGAFNSNLENWIDCRDIKLWIHGHVHNNNDYMIGDTRVITNPRGYSRFINSWPENTGFNPELMVDV